MSDLLENYLRELRDIRRSGAATPETSYYPALSNLLNGVGQPLRPPVRAVLQLANKGAGLPDGGLFTADQLRGSDDAAPLQGQVPARGVIEAKPTSDDIDAVADSEQVARYLARYGLVLVTNYRDFVVVDRDPEGRARLGERYRLAADERTFWAAASDPRSAAERHGARFFEYLSRVLRRNAPLAAPKDVAFFLASYARDANARIAQSGLAGLAPIRDALQQTLGIQFQGATGQDFFRSTLVQTLFYGIFSAWVLWSKALPLTSAARFDWRTSQWTLRVPVIRAIFEHISRPSHLEPLELVEVLDWTGDALNRVDRPAFFGQFSQDQAVQYFYEPFLEAFDPDLRRTLGVWYTPPEVVAYMVERVDTVLGQELGIADGLADPRVHVLDPCTGTGSFLVAVLRRIARTLRERGDDALLGEDLKRAAIDRVHGFELLPAPFVVAHLQIGLLLQDLGAPFSDRTNERASVYLTNALTGWDTAAETAQLPMFPELGAERDLARQVKHADPILVVIGNPPYNGYPGVAIQDERTLSEAYRVATRTRQPQGQGLNDLYVRFFRMAERRIVEQTGQGVVCFISNASWLDGLSHTAMRERYQDVFDHVWIDNLNGDSRRTGKLTPEGRPDPSVFSTEWNREGIQVGTAIATMVRHADHAPFDQVRFRQLWGRDKLATLAADAAGPASALAYHAVAPAPQIGLPWLPHETQKDYLGWPSLPDLFPVSFPGIKTSRDEVVVDIDRDRLMARMERYFDPTMSHEELACIAPRAMEDSGGFTARATRDRLRQRGFLPDNVVRFCYRPFDVRWLYWEPETRLLDRNREEYVPHVGPGNHWIVCQQRPRRDWSPPQSITSAGCLDLMDRGANCTPVLMNRAVVRTGESLPGFDVSSANSQSQTNLSESGRSYLSALGTDLPGDSPFYHSLAVMHADSYKQEHIGALGQDWPKVPLPATREVLTASAALGRQIAALLDPETPVLGVTTGTVRHELRTIGNLRTVGGAALDVAGGDLALRAGWGRGGAGRPTMPGRGKTVTREFTPEEAAALATWRNPLGLPSGSAFAPLGGGTLDVYLNDRAYWGNIPANVWSYSLGGYQVIKKWLSYREFDILGRALTTAEVREVQAIARRIAALLLLQPALDANYQAVIADLAPWAAGPTGDTGQQRLTWLP